MKVEVTILGSGTCHPSFGAPRRAHPGFLVSRGEGENLRHLLLDCSAGIAERLVDIGVKPHRITQLAVSHAHPDHCFIPGFLQTCLCHEMWEPGFSWEDSCAFPELDLYAPGHIIKSLPTLNAFYFEGEGENGLPFPRIHPYDMTPPDQKIGPFRRCSLGGDAWLEARSVFHDSGKCNALAFRIEANGKVIAYSGDAGFDPDSDTSSGLLAVARNADLFICEASARVGNEQSARTYGHLNPRQAGKIALEAGARHLVLTHYSGADSDEVMIEDCRQSGFGGQIIIAKDGDIYAT